MVDAESYTFARQMSTTASPHSLNTFQVSSYQNWRVQTPSDVEAEFLFITC
jgi:hypothetical protein